MDREPSIRMPFLAVSLAPILLKGFNLVKKKM